MRFEFAHISLSFFLSRRGSRIITDRFPKREPKAQASRGVRGHAPPGNFLDFNSFKSPFLDIGQFHYKKSDRFRP